MKTSFKLPDSIEDFCVACVPVGSRVTCNPPPKDTDQDVLCLVSSDELETFYQWIENHDWDYEGDSKYALSEFASYRKEFPELGEVNLIITTAPNWFDAFMDATRECKEKNVMDKAGRIAVFEKYIPQKKKEKKSVNTKLEELLAAQAVYNNSYLIQGNQQTIQAGTPIHTNSLWDFIGNTIGTTINEPYP